MTAKVLRGAVAVAALLVLACAKPPTSDPNPQPDGYKPVTQACARAANIPVMCIEFYADQAAQLHITVDAIYMDSNNEIHHATSPLGDVTMPIRKTITVAEGGGAVGYTIALDGKHSYNMTGTAAGSKGVGVGCRVIHRGKEVVAAAFYGDQGIAPCAYTGR